MGKYTDFPISSKFGEWEIIGPPFSKKSHHGGHNIYYLCQCSCGTKKEVRAIHLVLGKGSGNKRGSTKCVNCRPNSVRKHGESRSRLYKIWRAMKERCYLPQNMAYQNYGGRGITVCVGWKNSYLIFREWALKNGYAPSLQIDRINNDGNYGPDNCRFVTPKENNRNRRNSQLITAFGETKTAGAWPEDYRCKVSNKILMQRISRGWSPEMAISHIPDFLRPKATQIMGA